MSTMTNEDLTERFGTLTDEINTLQAERAEVSKALIAAGIEADEQTKADLEHELHEAQEAADALAATLAAAETAKAALDQRIDSGDDSVSALEVVEADMAVRTTKGKQKDAIPTLRKAERALEPFRADNHLALLAAEAINALVDVPVLIRKRPGDVQGLANAVILSQTEPAKGYGTVDVSGSVRLTEVGTTGLDPEALERALRDTGSEVSVSGSLIDYDVARWPVPRLAHPSVQAVTEFDRVLSHWFDQELKVGKVKGQSYRNYEARWQTIKTDLGLIQHGKSKGTLIAKFGVEGERPPLEQVRMFLNRALANFRIGVHTSAGRLDKFTVTDMKDLGPWVGDDEKPIPGKSYTVAFGVTIELDFSYDPVEV